MDDPVYSFNEVLRHIDLWKKSCVTSRKKIFTEASGPLEKLNQSGLELQEVRFGTREAFAIEYLESILQEYAKLMEQGPDKVLRERGHH